jgi:DnaK suppressor protein
VAQKRSKKKELKKADTTEIRKSNLSGKELEKFKEMLLEKRREIFQSVYEMEDETLRKSRLDATGDLSSMPIHMADLGSDNYEQEFALELMDGERKLLREIDEALTRIEEGTYGICEGLNKPIPKSRLKAQPWARYSVEYAEMLEKGSVKEEQ